MRKLFFTLALCFTLAAKGQTTIEEWNYITKGYKMQVESGLDMKRGYKIVDVGNYTYFNRDATRTLNFKKLIRTNKNEVCAIMVEYIKSDNKRTDVNYFCIPHRLSSPEIWELSNAQIETFVGEPIGKAFTHALFRFISNNDL